eukprot:COSAG01_NODE_11746_length_1868_cov_1.820237_2_plen_74_part_00
MCQAVRRSQGRKWHSRVSAAGHGVYLLNARRALNPRIHPLSHRYVYAGPATTLLLMRADILMQHDRDAMQSGG